MYQQERLEPLKLVLPIAAERRCKIKIMYRLNLMESGVEHTCDAQPVPLLQRG